MKNLNDVNLYLNSKIVLLNNNISDNLLNHLKHKELSLLELFEISNYNVSEFIKLIQNFMKNKDISILKNDNEKLYENLLAISNYIYSEFMSISGIKMRNDMEKKIKEIILLNNLNLIIKNHKIYNIELFSYELDKKIKNFKSFVENLINYSVKIYSEEFIKNISKKLNKDLEVLIIDLLK
jgi:hypothetical protein